MRLRPPGARAARATVASVVRRTPPYKALAEELLRTAHDRDRLAARLASRSRQDLSFVFVVTYGRSGSTLLQGILDSIPGWLIRGENGGAVYHLYRHFTEITSRPQSRRREPPFPVTDAWFGFDQYPRRLAVAQIRALVIDTLLRPGPDTRVTGFKEIRWDYPDLPAYLRFLQRIFPGARFILNTRSHEDVAKSKWWARADDPLAELARIEELQSAAADELGDAVYRVRFDDYVEDPAVLRGLFEWLGEEFDEGAVRSVLAVPHSY